MDEGLSTVLNISTCIFANTSIYSFSEAISVNILNVPNWMDTRTTHRGTSYILVECGVTVHGDVENAQLFFNNVS